MREAGRVFNQYLCLRFFKCSDGISGLKKSMEGGYTAKKRRIRLVVS